MSRPRGWSAGCFTGKNCMPFGYWNGLGVLESFKKKICRARGEYERTCGRGAHIYSSFPQGLNTLRRDPGRISIAEARNFIVAHAWLTVRDLKPIDRLGRLSFATTSSIFAKLISHCVGVSCTCPAFCRLRAGILFCCTIYLALGSVTGYVILCEKTPTHGNFVFDAD